MLGREGTGGGAARFASPLSGVSAAPAAPPARPGQSRFAECDLSLECRL